MNGRRSILKILCPLCTIGVAGCLSGKTQSPTRSESTESQTVAGDTTTRQAEGELVLSRTPPDEIEPDSRIKILDGGLESRIETAAASSKPVDLQREDEASTAPIIGSFDCLTIAGTSYTVAVESHGDETKRIVRALRKNSTSATENTVEYENLSDGERSYADEVISSGEVTFGYHASVPGAAAFLFDNRYLLKDGVTYRLRTEHVDRFGRHHAIEMTNARNAGPCPELSQASLPTATEDAVTDLLDSSQNSTFVGQTVSEALGELEYISTYEHIYSIEVAKR